MGKISNFCLTTFEIVNELYTAVGAGVLGIVVLFTHGIRTNQNFKTVSVICLTASSFLYICQQKHRKKPKKKRVVFITGCDSGLGYSLTQHCADLGFTVIASFLDLESKGARFIQQKYTDVVQVRLDVTDSENVIQVAKQVEIFLCDKFELYALINNAGVMTFGEFEWLTERLMQQHLDVNLSGTFKVTKAFCHLLRQHKGRIITITSHCALTTLPGLSVYGATKAALAAWSDGLRVELGKYGVKVITFIPGSFPTESNIMSKQLLNVKEMHDAFSIEQHDFYSDYFKRYNIYLSYVGGGPSDPKKIEDVSMYNKFNGALLDSYPFAVYKNEPFRYAFYHFLFKFSPTVQLRDYFVGMFMQMPDYNEI